VKKISIAILLFVLPILANCAPNAPVDNDHASYEEISAETLAGMLEERRDSFVLVNTYTPFEGNIPNTDLSIPFDEISEYLDRLSADKDAEIVLYCRSGNKSRSAAETLADLGYTNLKSVVGGFTAWKDAGFPFESEP